MNPDEGSQATDAVKQSTEAIAWKRFCERMEAIGERILEDDFPGGEVARVAGFAHLADQVSCWLGWAIPHGDPDAPFFHRNNDLFTQWGGPNQDNVYHHARIDPRRRYRVAGRMHSCEHFVITLRKGFMHMKTWGTLASVDSIALGIAAGDEFSIEFGGDGRNPDAIPIPEGVTTLSLREYYVDWQPEEPATFTIECLDDLPTPGPLSPARLAEQLDHAAVQVESSMLGWNDYLRSHREKGEDNAFALPQKVTGGLPDARYAFLFWNLRPDEALVVETDLPEARYWGLQLATMGWFEPVDAIHRITSINQHQARPSADGRVRFVLCGHDPGVPNWLDTAHHPSGLLTYRWFWPEKDPTPTTRVVPIEHVRAALPADTPVISDTERKAEIRARKHHLAWRFRT